ncbi:MAG TPA: hypothetical protein VFC03_00680 [Acidimicrobiales bacterium]|nr:hypothetical protein [Acidimicrobiales bacterium]
MRSVSVGGHRAFSSRVLAIRIRADIRNALKKEADRRVLGESYLPEVLIEKGLKELLPVELG